MFIGSAIATGSYSSMVAGTPLDTGFEPLLLDNAHGYEFQGGVSMKNTAFSIPTDNNSITMGGWFKNVNVGVASAKVNLFQILPFSVETNAVYQFGPNGIGLDLVTFAGTQTFETHTVADVGFDPTDLQWHHVLLSFESGVRVKLFLDGVKVIDEATSKVSISAMPAFNIFTAEYKIGSGGSMMNNFASWERCLTEQECIDLYNDNCMVDPRDSQLSSSNDLADLWLFGGGLATSGAPFNDNHDYTGVIPFTTYKNYSQISPVHRLLSSSSGILIVNDARTTEQPTCS